MLLCAYSVQPNFLVRFLDTCAYKKLLVSPQLKVMTNWIVTFDIGAVWICRWPLLEAAGLAVALLPVKVQSASAGELFLAAAARVGSLVDVQQLVRLEIWELREPLLANVALVRLLPRVDFQMRFQVAGLRKTFGANVAFKRPFTRMHPHMKLQMLHHSEPLLANSAPVRFLFRVHQAVVLQVGQILKTLLTIVAFVNYLSVLPLQCVRYRSNSAALAPRRRTAGADGR